MSTSSPSTCSMCFVHSISLPSIPQRPTALPPILLRFATIIEAHSVQQNGTPEQIENYINDKVEKITEVWENSLEEDEE